VLIFSRLRKTLSASWRPACAVVALTLSPATLAHADTVTVTGCVWAPSGIFWGATTGGCVKRYGEAGDPYVRTVPPPKDEVEKARATERDHKWLERCKPVVFQDRYGVPRYHYAAAGCGFGVIE
jgi:hypothetical protein